VDAQGRGTDHCFRVSGGWQSAERAIPGEVSLRERRWKPNPAQRYIADGSARTFLRRVDQALFQRGYIAGWQSVRGGDDHPALVPQSTVFVGQVIYMVGFSRGARDASP
jgi:hypothetical protein